MEANLMDAIEPFITGDLRLVQLAEL
jgi:hypothetical protein